MRLHTLSCKSAADTDACNVCNSFTEPTEVKEIWKSFCDTQLGNYRLLKIWNTPMLLDTTSARLQYNEDFFEQVKAHVPGE